MKPKIHVSEPNLSQADTSEEILILTDGRILAHNLTPDLAAVLRELNPNDEPMRRRALTDRKSRKIR